MATPSKARNFFGRVVEGALPGKQYNAQTGQYSNVGSGIAGRAASLLAAMYGGPAAGAAVTQAANRIINNGNLFGSSKPGRPVREPITGMPGVQAGNLGFGAPQQMQAPSLNFSPAGFGNYAMPGAMPAQGQPWQPQSAWGQQMAQPAQQQPASPFNPYSQQAQAAAAAMNMPKPNTTQGADTAYNQAGLFLGNMDRAAAQARNAMNPRLKARA